MGDPMKGVKPVVSKLVKFILLSFLLLFSVPNIYGQGRPYEGPDDPAGDIAAQREGRMIGNRVLLYFQNNTELAYWPNTSTSKWPNDHTGTGMIDGLALLVGARVYIENDSIPVTDPDIIQSRFDLDTLYYCQTSYRQGMDTNSSGTIEWGLYPVFGYFNENSEHPAMSNREKSWPIAGWPSRGDELKWPDEWDGRFGRGVMYADLETYFVANDAQDQEYLGRNDIIKYYPRPGVKIGDKRPDVTIQKGLPWGGIGIRIKVRGYQWNNLQSRDAIFWEYDISNISDYDLTEVAFGYWLDNGIGHEGYNADQDDIGFFDKLENMSYSWDVDGIGAGGLRTGVVGISYLESPGVPDDNLDNDDDGLIDEKRDNQASFMIGPYDGISDLQKFLDWYGLQEEDLKEHWDADEDQDWQDGYDANGNGVYDEGEDPGDDVGLDGVGPTDINYYGPDEGECNHKPDYLEGVGCEPNFAATDISESDMIGLTSFHLFRHPDPTGGGEPPFMRHDKEAWEVFAVHGLVEFFGEISNLVEEFGSGPFPLLQGRTERVSMAELHSYEALSGLNSADHSAPALFQKKRIVQVIYESDYRFAKPPKMPTLKAIAGEGKVFLTWDDAADRLTREPMLKGENDFEGYKLYKATDKYFADAEVLVDMYGNPSGKKPIFQCDLINGKKGAVEFILFNGEAFYLGEDTGIQHYFVDEDVQNGRTYYYGLVAYDYGIDGLEVSIMPSENNMVLELDEAEEIRYHGKNVQIVTPHQQAAGFIPPSIKIDDETSLIGSGLVIPEIIDINSVKENNRYKLKFHVDTTGHLRPVERFRAKHDILYSNSGFSVYDVTNHDSLIYTETPENYPGDNLKYVAVYDSWSLNESLISDPFEGIQINIEAQTEAEFDLEKSGWIVGYSPVKIIPSSNESDYFPWQYEIIFTGNDSSYASIVGDNKGIKNTDDILLYNNALLEQVFNFYVINKSFPDSNGVFEKLDLVVEDVNQNGQFDLLEDNILAGHVFKFGSKFMWGGTVFSIDFRDISDESQMPKANDVYRVDFKRPFIEQDSLLFTIMPSVEVDKNKLKGTMDDIKVVPNPYIATNMMEQAISNPFLNQRRELMFTHIPARCTIKIFTSSGVFVDEIPVYNPPDNGMVHWDMLTKEGLEIAAGIYIYHVKSNMTGEKKLGKFAVIK